MGASFTLAGEDLIAQKQAAKQPLTASRFILANVPGLNPNGPVDRAAGKPAAAQIVATYSVTQAGYVNPGQVVYSLMLGSDIGDFDWNWIGLESAEGVLLMVAYVPLQQKRRNIPPLQLGNNVTRNFLLKFDGAQELTGVTIDASTWQHDFTVRLAGIDERERLSNRDIFGRACFLGPSLQLEKANSAYRLKPGIAYIEGIRLELKAAQPVTVPATPSTAWLDVALQRELNDVVGTFNVVFGDDLVDYSDSLGVRHHLVPIAKIQSPVVISDLRASEPIEGELIRHFAARAGDYPRLRARATTKEDVGLDQIPNATSSAIVSDSSEVLATTRMVQAIRQALLSALETKASKATTLSGYGITDDVQWRTEPLTGKFTVECLDITQSGQESGILIRTKIPVESTVMPHLTFKGCLNGYTAPFEMHLSWYFYEGKFYIPAAFITGFHAQLGGGGVRVFLSHENGLVNVRLDFGGVMYIPRLAITAYKSAGYGGNYAWYTGWVHTSWNRENAIAGEVMVNAHTVLSTANLGVAGLALAKAATPAAARAVLELPTPPANTAGLGSPLWWKCADTGLIKQTGRYVGTGTGSPLTITFPVAFPNACTSILIYADNSSADHDLASLSNTHFVTRTSSAVAGSWLVHGY